MVPTSMPSGNMLEIHWSGWYPLLRIDMERDLSQDAFRGESLPLKDSCIVVGFDLALSGNPC